MTKHRIMVFPAGSEIGLEIYHSLKYSHHVELFGASGKNDHASFLYEADRYIEDPLLYVDRPDFVERLNGYLCAHAIEFIYPTHDTICSFLAAQQARLTARVVTSSAKTNRIARHKSLTYEALKGFDFCPRLFGRSDPSLQFPRFLKPDDGQGGKRAYRADTPDELAFLLSRHPDLLVMEYLPGDELSVDCFSDYCGQLLFIGPRTRERVQMGISFRSTAVPLSDEVRRIAQVIHDSFQLDGAWFFQVKQDAQGRFKLLEFAPRQSSTMGLYRHAGVNFALLSLFNALRIPVTIRRNDYALQLDRCLHNRFRSDLVYRRVYIDFDETIVDGERVHGRVMDYLYQCRNNGIEIVLLTKHRQDLGETLRRCAIAESLFHRTVQLANDEDKSDHIDPRDAIFIDNYWRDRRAVSAKLGIPVFDVDAIECLMR